MHHLSILFVKLGECFLIELGVGASCVPHRFHSSAETIRAAAIREGKLSLPEDVRSYERLELVLQPRDLLLVRSMRSQRQCELSLSHLADISARFRFATS